MAKRMTAVQLSRFLRALSDKELNDLICAANAEDRRRFDERCAAHPANAKQA